MLIVRIQTFRLILIQNEDTDKGCGVCCLVGWLSHELSVLIDLHLLSLSPSPHP